MSSTNHSLLIIDKKRNVFVFQQFNPFYRVANFAVGEFERTVVDSTASSTVSNILGNNEGHWPIADAARTEMIWILYTKRLNKFKCMLPNIGDNLSNLYWKRFFSTIRLNCQNFTISIFLFFIMLLLFRNAHFIGGNHSFYCSLVLLNL